MNSWVNRVGASCLSMVARRGRSALRRCGSAPGHAIRERPQPSSNRLDMQDGFTDDALKPRGTLNGARDHRIIDRGCASVFDLIKSMVRRELTDEMADAVSGTTVVEARPRQRRKRVREARAIGRASAFSAMLLILRRPRATRVTLWHLGRAGSSKSPKPSPPPARAAAAMLFGCDDPAHTSAPGGAAGARRLRVQAQQEHRGRLPPRSRRTGQGADQPGRSRAYDDSRPISAMRDGQPARRRPRRGNDHRLEMGLADR